MPICIAILFTVLGVLLPGSGIRILLTNRGLIRVKDDTVSRLLVHFSLGVWLNAIIFFICWVLTLARSALPVALTLLGVASATAMYITWKDFDAKRKDRALIFMLLLGSGVGLFAAFNFPNTLDSLQVLQVQQFILGSNGHSFDESSVDRISKFFFGGIEIPAQSGFAGLLFIPALLQLSLPVATIGAANKVVLLALTAVVSLYVVCQIKSPAAIATAILLFITIVVSQFGISGLFFTGKDSVFSVLMSVASIGALAAHDEEHGDEAGIFMSAGILLGAVSVPYLLVFWLIFFVSAPRANLKLSVRQAWWCVVPLSITVVSVRAMFPQHGAVKIDLGPTLLLGITCLGIFSFAVRHAYRHPAKNPVQSSRLIALIPIVCTVGIALILPVTGGSMGGHDGASAFAPLDGKTTAIDYAFTMSRNNNAGIIVLCLLAMCFGPLFLKTLRTPWSIAALGFLPATSLFAFVHVRYDWHLLPMFNLWDISRDTIQWYAGAFGGVIALIAALAVFDRIAKRRLGPALVAIAFFLALPWSYAYFAGPWKTRPTITPSGGSYEPASAKAFDLIWREARGWPVYVDTQSPSFNAQFYSYQMFGSLTVEAFSPAVVGKLENQLFLIDAKNLPSIMALATDQKSSGWVRKLGDREYALAIKKDGRSNMEIGALRKYSFEYEGAYGLEQFGNVPFRWVSQNSKIKVYHLYGKGVQCLAMGFTSARIDSMQKIRIKSQLEERIFDLPRAASFDRPHTEKICMEFDQDGKAEVELTSSEPGQGFPGDGRSVAFGLVNSME